MVVKVQKSKLPRKVTDAYCKACYALFGKTLSVMAGEALMEERWYGIASVTFIDWLLGEPYHCAMQLVYFRRRNRL